VGLDWEPLARPKPEHADEFATLLARLQTTGDESVLDRMGAISIPVFETLGAPRVGYDDAVDAWLRTKVSEDDFYEMYMKMHGYYVLDLLPPCDGFPVYRKQRTSWSTFDRYVFPGAVLELARHDLGALFDEARRYLAADHHERYGEALLSCARRFARKHRIMEVELVGTAEYGRGSVESRAHIMFAAARWCLYWSRRGHGLAPS